jgi:GNAT superfamily N-acetyltransferase
MLKRNLEVNPFDAVVAVERLSDLRAEAEPLLVEHWKELASYGDIPLTPDWPLYEKLDAAGFIRVYTVRVRGALVGYSVFFVRKHMHYASTSWATNDILWLHPDFRNWGVGSDLARFWEKDLYALGVSVIHVDAKVAHQALIGLLVGKLGYSLITSGMEKRID